MRLPLHADNKRATRWITMLQVQWLQYLLFIQLIIVVLGATIRIADIHGNLVKVMPFSQIEGLALPGNYWDGLRQHKYTYYFAGLLTFVVLASFTAVLRECLPHCLRHPCGEAALKLCDCCMCAVTLCMVLQDLSPGPRNRPVPVEYVVQDLASPLDCGEEAPTPVQMEAI